MTTITFKAEHSEAIRLFQMLKAYGVKDIVKIEEAEENPKMTKEIFFKKIDKARKSKGTMLKSKEEIVNFFDNL